MILGEKQLLAADQQRFADASRDLNPLHMDPLFARRTPFGRQVVHGVHTLLWALDRFFEATGVRAPVSLDVRFAKPAFVGDALCAVLAKEAGDGRRLEVSAAGATVMTVLLDARASSPDAPQFEIPGDFAPSRSPRALDLEDLEGLAGALSLRDSAVQAVSLFPAACQALGADTVAALMATSRIVGMECPGLHSLFSGLSLALGRDTARIERVQWRVAKVDRRFRRIMIDVCGGGIAGQLETFLRAPPTPQLPMADVRAVVGPREFAGQHALIVGGSRGLGEVTAKIVAAGGGIPTVTYAVGREDAERLSEEIRAAGGQCRTLQYDVRRSSAPQLSALTDTPVALYYFATGNIFQRKAAIYEADLLREFLTFYVDGFHALCTELSARAPGRLVAFYPSTVALDKPVRDMTEYSLAKQAGETLCAHLASFVPDLEIVVRRLPRILTDQTATVFPVRSESPLEVMLPIVRQVQAATLAPSRS